MKRLPLFSPALGIAGAGASAMLFRMNLWTPIRQPARAVLAACSLALLAACGGGGDGGGGGGGGGGGTLPLLNYSGNSNAAVISTSNASGLVSGILGSSDAADAVAGAVAAEPAELRIFDSGQVGRGQQLGKSARELLQQSMRAIGAASTLSAVQLDETEMCIGGGSVRVFGTLNDITGTGTLTIQYINCMEDGETINGQGSFSVAAVDFGSIPPVPTDFTLNFPRLEFRAAGISHDVGGSVRVQLSGLAETLTQNLVTLNNLTGRMTRSANFVAVTIYDNFSNPTSISSTLTGRYSDSVHGFVDVTTSAPLTSASRNEHFPRNGQITLVGDSSRAVRVAAVSTSLATLALDLDGNGIFERNVTLAWLELSATSGADLADDDEDGMHNGWESTRGLSVNDPNDALADTDGDGATSRAEYRAGTDPNDPSSLPTVAPGTFAGTVLSLPGVTDLIFDSGTQRIYAAIGGNPGSVVPINPVTLALGTPIPVGIDPEKLARSQDGLFLYVGLRGESSVQRINLTTRAVDLTIPLGSDPQFGALHAEDIAVLPGDSQAIAVSLKAPSVIPRHRGVAIFDGVTRRANVTQVHTGSNVIEFSASADLLYGYNTETTEFGFRRMAVDASGVTVTDVYDSFMPGGQLLPATGDILFHAGVVYSTGGRAVDPVSRTPIGDYVFDPPSSMGVSVVADASIDRVFILAVSAGTPTWRIHPFELSTRQPLAAIEAPGVTGDASSLVRWGANGLAFRTSGGQVYITP